MSDLVHYSTQQNIAVLTIDNPPVNALSSGVPEGIEAGLKRALADDSIVGIVLIGEGRTFIAGADIREFGRMASGQLAVTDTLQRVLTALEDSPKPVVAALHGTALGGGLETAMACHWRVAMPTARVGQPEVNLGLIPGAGGTQRLPRLCGINRAAEICATGRMVGATEALEMGVLDKIVEGKLLDGGIDFALDQAAQGNPPRKVRELQDRLDHGQDSSPAPEQLKQLLAHKSRGMTAPQRCIEAVELAGTLPFDEALKSEGEIFRECLQSDQSQALIHIFFGERIVAKVPGLPKDLPHRTIERAAVIGAGTMGTGIAMTYLNAGIPVVLKEIDSEPLQRGVERIRSTYEKARAKGRISAEQFDTLLALLTPTTEYGDLANADILVEAVFEGMDLKKRVFAEMDAVAKPSAILASNTSTLDIDEIASATSRPESVIGHHFFSPANIMKLLEIVRGQQTSDEVIATSMGLARRLKKVAVLVGNCFGFLGNRMFEPYLREAQFLLEEGATVEQVDRALHNFGMAMGPLAVSDLAGIDVSWRIREEIKDSIPADIRHPLVLPKLYELGRYGQKTSAGWYRYDGRTPVADPEVENLIVQTGLDAGIEQRTFDDQEIVERIIYALINEGARVLTDHIAQRSVDIDIAYVYGYGFPAWRGGPMKHGDLTGLSKICQRVEEFHQQHGSLWEPAPLLQELSKSGGTFSEN
ncbi:MAG: 3-hydroxyacyl-CoA dehydrogenase NAD-binding domain-containing protein [Pirellulales bacterium]